MLAAANASTRSLLEGRSSGLYAHDTLLALYTYRAAIAVEWLLTLLAFVVACILPVIVHGALLVAAPAVIGIFAAAAIANVYRRG